MLGRASSVEHSSARYAARRWRRRRRVFIASSILLFIVLGALVWGLHQSFVRISRVTIYGADQSLASYATSAMWGSYLGIIPRDSTFFYPASRIHADIKAAYPDIAAISLFRDGLDGLSIKIDYRVPVARWCDPDTGGLTKSPHTDAAGLESTTSTAMSGLRKSESDPIDCYVFDANGFVYASTTDQQVVNPFVIYEPLSVSSSSPVMSGAEPIGATLPNADAFPAAFDFARELSRPGSPVTRIVFRTDEVDDYLASGTRVTYVLGDEQDAYTALTSARANLDLADGSVEYIDLRFPGKVYVKRK